MPLLPCAPRPAAMAWSQALNGLGLISCMPGGKPQARSGFIPSPRMRPVGRKIGFQLPVHA